MNGEGMEIFLFMVTQKHIILILIQHTVERIFLNEDGLVGVGGLLENDLCVVGVTTHEEVMIGFVVEEEVGKRD